MNSRAGIIIETTIVLPILILVFFFIADLYFVSNAYIGVNQMVREGIMTGATLENINDTTPPELPRTGLNVTSPPNPNDPSCTESDCGHQILHWRIWNIWQSVNLNRMELTEIKTEYIREQRLLDVSVTVTYNGFSPFFRNYEVTISSRGLSRSNI